MPMTPMNPMTTITLADAATSVLGAASRPHFSLGEYNLLTDDGEDLQALQKERARAAALAAPSAAMILALTKGEAMGHPDWGVWAAWGLING